MDSPIEATPRHKIDWLGSAPFLFMHLLPLGALFTGVHWAAWVVMGVLFFVRRWFVTAGYHRYFSHRSYKLSRGMQFVMALGASTAVQQGPIWWAAIHRHHHKYSDQPQDVHSPKQGFFWSHIGWILSSRYNRTMTELVPDLVKFPELRWLDKYYLVPQLGLAGLVFLLGLLITGGWVGALGFMFIGFFLSTILLSHTTFTINSLSHVFGKRRFATRDTSRNNWFLALITGGEGWHNNHHHYQASARQGFRWYEIDTNYYVLWLLSKIGLVRDLKQPPAHLLQKHLVAKGATDIGMFQKHWERAVRALQSTSKATGEKAAEQKRRLEDLYAATRAKVEEIARLGQSEPAA